HRGTSVTTVDVCRSLDCALRAPLGMTWSRCHPERAQRVEGSALGCHPERAQRVEGSAPEALMRGGHPFTQGFLTNILNPKVALFYLTFLPQFIPADAPVLRTSLLLAMIHNVLGFAWLSLYARFVDRLRVALTRPMVKAWLERVTGGVLVALGARLAWDRR
ncbi:MAG TPA: LysE family translocator, partial [Gemmatimonadaceae bacterium]|nr:LysE family translocator [Gemmatimonadaceae bacterium]